VPPAEAEAAYYAALEEPAALAAWLKPTSLRGTRDSSSARWRRPWWVARSRGHAQ